MGNKLPTLLDSKISIMNFNEALPSATTLTRTIEKLVKKSSSSSAKVKRESTKELYELAYRGARMPSEAIDAFVARLGDDDEETRESASWGLKHCSPFSIPSLVSCLNNKVAEVRRLAARALVSILQASDESRPRRAVVEALGALGPQAIEALHVLKTTVDDFDPEVSEAAIASITQIRPQRH